jgi:serine/threonine protein kinase
MKNKKGYSSKSPLLKIKKKCSCNYIFHYYINKIYKYISSLFLINKRYKKIKYIGEGTFGKVTYAIDKKRVYPTYVVLKEIIPAERTYNEIWNEAYQEIEFFKQIGNSSYIVNFKEYFTYKQYPCLVYEYIGPTLFDFIKKANQSISYNTIYLIMHDILHGLNEIHNLDYIHADMKDSNVCIWYDITIRAKIIDLGGVEKLNKSGKNDSKCYICTRSTRAPELLEDLEWGKPIDLWSVGCILYKLLTHQYLFEEDSAKSQLIVIQDFYTNIESEEDLFNKLRKNILLYHNINLLEINKLIVLLTKLLKYNQGKRINVKNSIQYLSKNN